MVESMICESNMGHQKKVPPKKAMCCRGLGHAAVVWVPVVLGAREVPGLTGSKADHQDLRKGMMLGPSLVHLDMWGTVQYK